MSADSGMVRHFLCVQALFLTCALILPPCTESLLAPYRVPGTNTLWPKCTGHVRPREQLQTAGQPQYWFTRRDSSDQNAHGVSTSSVSCATIKMATASDMSAQTLSSRLLLRRQADRIFGEAVSLYQNIFAKDQSSGWASSLARDEHLVLGLSMLDQVLDLDFAGVRETCYIPGANDLKRTAANVTCVRPRGQHDDSVFICDEALVAMDLEQGRLCDGGACSEACSRVHIRSFASTAECAQMISRANQLMPPGNAAAGTLETACLACPSSMLADAD